MSVQNGIKRRTARHVRDSKGGTPLVMVTAYDAGMARLVDPHADMLLVGDSVGMVHHGLASTVPVTLDMMILHGAAVVRGSRQALVVVDMPFGTYEESPKQAFRNAAHILQETGAGAVKLEGGVRMAATIAFLGERGIPVMAHVGMTPQAIHVLGSFRAVGRSEAERAKILADAEAVAAAGAFAIVIEAVEEPLAAEITQRVAVPTIGIGASAACDGQVLVLDDMLGLTERVPRFVKRYAELGKAVDAAMAAYAGEVRERRFPAPEHTYPRKD
ncbi:MAG: 3-methyl-2-oxobutanoate hydroxymethyltransferase [Beijerinckiaceae bacterium]|nr:3-methyl-2-oxobutanoate hydroxymethyltransferase [Beijerinckiaceae bacterium]MCZ8299590.1 3-methyl-2-oxobutanoate hydroxymethyltransferase [Beijerinckiaceae bacterium]